METGLNVDVMNKTVGMATATAAITEDTMYTYRQLTPTIVYVNNITNIH